MNKLEYIQELIQHGYFDDMSGRLRILVAMNAIELVSSEDDTR